MCWGLFNKVAGLKDRCFPVNTVKFLRTLFSENTSGRLLLLFSGFIHMYENLESLQGPGSWTATPWEPQVIDSKTWKDERQSQLLWS